MSWDSLVENTGYWLEVASNRLARRALHVEAKSLNKFSEDDAIGDWIAFLPEKSLTKSLKRDVKIVLAKKLAKATHNQKDKSKVYPEDDI